MSRSVRLKSNSRCRTRLRMRVIIPTNALRTKQAAAEGIGVENPEFLEHEFRKDLVPEIVGMKRVAHPVLMKPGSLLGENIPPVACVVDERKPLGDSHLADGIHVRIKVWFTVRRATGDDGTGGLQHCERAVQSHDFT